MAMQTAKTQFPLKQAILEHKDDETDYGQDFTRLPPDMSGVARLTTISFGKYKTGKYQGKDFVRFGGVVVEPEEHTYTPQIWEGDEKHGRVKTLSPVTERVKGRQTSIMIELCDTESTNRDGQKVITTAKEHVGEFLNELRKLAGDEDYTKDLDGSEQQLQAKMDALTKVGPYFRISTNAGKPTFKYPKPNVFERWYGSKGMEGYLAPSANGQSGTVDNTVATTTTAGADSNADGAYTVEQLVKMAGGDDQAAQDARDELEKQAVAVGYTAENVDAANNWDEVATMIANPKTAGSEEGSADENDGLPNEGDIYDYKVIDKKTGNPMKDKNKKELKPVEVEVKAVDKEKRTVDLLNNTDRKTKYTGVPVDQLIGS